MSSDSKTVRAYIVIPVEVDPEGTLKELESEAMAMCAFYSDQTPPGFVDDATGRRGPPTDNPNGPIVSTGTPYFKIRISE